MAPAQARGDGTRAFGACCLARRTEVPMDEKVKDKDADTTPKDTESDLDRGLEETFPASDPVSATREPEEDADKKTT
jgi:hypothetical protein